MVDRYITIQQAAKLTSVSERTSATSAGRAETRIKQYNRLHRLYELAEFPCKLRRDGTNPVRKYLRPAPDAEKLFGFLYPSEVLALLRTDEGRRPERRRGPAHSSRELEGAMRASTDSGPAPTSTRNNEPSSMQ